MAVTLSDIAKDTDSSISSVSAALKGNRSTAKVSDKKRKEILEAAQRLGYRPSYAARTLKIGKTTVLGMVIGEIHTPYYGEMSSMLMKEAEKYGYSIQIYVSNWEKERSEKAVNLLLGGRCDGIILFETGIYGKNYEYIKKNKIPVISLSNPIPEIPLVGEDWDSGFAETAEYLLSKNLKKIIFLGDKVTFLERPKLKSLKNVFAEYSLDLDFVECHNKPELVYDFGINFKKLKSPPQAILTENDTLGIALLKSLFDAGIKVPEDLSVVGYNDTALGQYSTPALTTIGFDKENYVKTAINMIMKMIDNKKPDKYEINFPTFLRRRHSA